MKYESEPGQIYFIDVDTVNAGIPYADSFSVQISFCLSRCDNARNSPSGSSKGRFGEGPDHSSLLTVMAAIKYQKTVWGLVKSKSVLGIVGDASDNGKE